LCPGVASAPREVNLIAKDYSFLPDTLDLVPGETVLLHVINGGLEVHEAVLGGTGIYAGMTGSADGKWVKRDFSKASLTFNLR